MLLGKYCHSTSFINVSSPSFASHGWRGIIIGRDLLRKGLGWSIGDGRSIPVWESHWLSTKIPLAPIGPPTASNSKLMVRDLLFPSSEEWNLSAIRSHLPQYENVIRQLIPSSNPMNDSLVWLPEKLGVYSSKSGYALLHHILATTPSDFNWKRCIWNLKMAPKIKHFMWRIVNNALPVSSNLALRGITVSDSLCKKCSQQEDKIHLLFSCPYATRVWELAPTLFKPQTDLVESTGKLLQDLMRMLNLPPTRISSTPLYPWLLWNLWKTRNQLVFENRYFSEEETVLKSIKEANDTKLSTRF